jgi:hypothetical protein
MTRTVKLTSRDDFHTHEGEKDWQDAPDDATKALEELLSAIENAEDKTTDVLDPIQTALDRLRATEAGAELIRQAEERNDASE